MSITKKTAKVSAEKAVKPIAKTPVAAAAVAPEKKAAPKKTAVKKAAVEKPVITHEERMKKVEQAAYFKAEKCGFQGDPQVFWTEAEVEIDALFTVK